MECSEITWFWYMETAHGRACRFSRLQGCLRTRFWNRYGRGDGPCRALTLPVPRSLARRGPAREIEQFSRSQQPALAGQAFFRELERMRAKKPHTRRVIPTEELQREDRRR